MTPDLPPPKETLDDPVVGLKRIVPVALEDYFEGYNSMVQDEYQPYRMPCPVNGMKWQWHFVRRVRVFTKPLHYNIDGKSQKCERCEAWWKFVPNKPDEILLGVGAPV